MIAAGPHACGARGPIFRFLPLIWLLPLAFPAAATAQEGADDRAADRYRELTTVAPRQRCAAGGAAGDEIIVCGRRRDNLRYRLPPSRPVPGTRADQSVGGERFALQQYRSEGGSGSCSTVGPNGSSGCRAKAFRESLEASGGRSPGLIARALTYLDPDE